jgi:hypothetical protein
MCNGLYKSTGRLAKRRCAASAWRLLAVTRSETLGKYNTFSTKGRLGGRTFDVAVACIETPGGNRAGDLQVQQSQFTRTLLQSLEQDLADTEKARFRADIAEDDFPLPRHDGNPGEDTVGQGNDGIIGGCSKPAAYGIGCLVAKPCCKDGGIIAMVIRATFGYRTAKHVAGINGVFWSGCSYLDVHVRCH